MSPAALSPAASSPAALSPAASSPAAPTVPPVSQKPLIRIFKPPLGTVQYT